MGEHHQRDSAPSRARRDLGRAGVGPAPTTSIIRGRRNSSTGTSCPRSTIRSPAAARCRSRRSGSGWRAYASDLNPVAVLINKAMIEIPPKFAGKPPVNPEARPETASAREPGRGAQGLAEDVRYYGQWMRDEAEKRIGHLYPKVEITAEMAKERPDLKPYVGRKLTVIAWLWARTVKSPNPAFAQVDVPLASTFMLSTKAGKEAYVEPVIEDGGYRFTVKVGKPKDAEAAKKGTKLSRGANFRCVMSGTPISGEYIKAEGVGGRMGARLMAVVAEGDRGRVYLSASRCTRNRGAM